MFVVQFVGNAPRTWLCRNELDLADQIAAPSLVDTSAELGFHAFELLAPRFPIRGNFQEPGLASDGVRMGRERLANDDRPRTREPCERRFGPLDPADGSPHEFTHFFHEGRRL